MYERTFYALGVEAHGQQRVTVGAHGGGNQVTRFGNGSIRPLCHSCLQRTSCKEDCILIHTSHCSNWHLLCCEHCVFRAACTSVLTQHCRTCIQLILADQGRSVPVSTWLWTLRSGPGAWTRWTFLHVGPPWCDLAPPNPLSLQTTPLSTMNRSRSDYADNTFGRAGINIIQSLIRTRE